MSIYTVQDVSRLLTQLATQAQALKEAQATWRCFHCGFETSDRGKAEAHFADDSGGMALCQAWGSWTDQERLEQLQSVALELNRERDDNATQRIKIEGLEFRVEGQISEIHSFAPFRKCDSIHQVFHVYDSMEGRALLAEQALKEAYEIIDDIATKGLGLPVGWADQDGKLLSELVEALRSQLEAERTIGHAFDDCQRDLANIKSQLEAVTRERYAAQAIERSAVESLNEWATRWRNMRKAVVELIGSRPRIWKYFSPAKSGDIRLEAIKDVLATIDAVADSDIPDKGIND